MWWMGTVYGVYLCFLLVEVWSMFSHHPRIHQAACTCSTGAALVAPTTLGAVFGVLAARPFWHGIFTPVLMTSSAFLAGTSLLGIAFYFVHRYRLAGVERAVRLGIPSIRLLMAIGLGIVSALIARQVVAGLIGSEPGLEEATLALVAGPLAIGFWGLRVVAGLLAPIALLVLPATRTPAGTLAASLLALGGVGVDRLLFVAAGQIAPTTAVSGVVSSPYAAYLPSPVEVAILVGATALVAFAYTLAERYLDMSESDFHLGLSWAWLARWRAARRVRAAMAAEARAARTPQR
jgi:Ni/Fe-hydrogenase subunit HybB-like protein